jgi:glutathione peroxidase
MQPLHTPLLLDTLGEQRTPHRMACAFPMLGCHGINMEQRMELFNIEAQRLDGTSTKLEAFRGKVLLVVNVASKCGFTPQYTGLEALYRDYHARGFEVLGFPCNQFANQEPGNAEEIASFCSTTYDVSFPMFAKVDVNGDKAHPLFQYLKNEKSGLLGTGAIKWNFTKFLVGKDGSVLKRYAPTDKPEKLRDDIEAALAA